MANALKRDLPLTFSRVRSIEGKVLVFTGPLGRDLTRRQARQLARRAGAFVLDSPSPSMNFLVIGNAAPNWLAGTAGGMKILKTMALREDGFQIKLMTVRHFRRLVGR